MDINAPESQGRALRAECGITLLGWVAGFNQIFFDLQVVTKPAETLSSADPHTRYALSCFFSDSQFSQPVPASSHAS